MKLDSLGIQNLRFGSVPGMGCKSWEGERGVKGYCNLDGTLGALGFPHPQPPCPPPPQSASLFELLKCDPCATLVSPLMTQARVSVADCTRRRETRQLPQPHSSPGCPGLGSSHRRGGPSKAHSFQGSLSQGQRVHPADTRLEQTSGCSWLAPWPFTPVPGVGIIDVTLCWDWESVVSGHTPPHDPPQPGRRLGRRADGGRQCCLGWPRPGLRGATVLQTRGDFSSLAIPQPPPW